MSNRLTLCLYFCLSTTTLLLGSNLFVSSSKTPSPEAANTVLATASGDPLSFSHADVVQHLGSPLHMTTEAVANEYSPDQTDTLRTLTYDGLSLSFYETTQPPKSILYHLVLTTERYTTPEGLFVGQPHGQMLDALGYPSLRADNRYVYAATDTRPGELAVSLENNRVQQIEWMFFFE